MFNVLSDFFIDFIKLCLGSPPTFLTDLLASPVLESKEIDFLFSFYFSLNYDCTLLVIVSCRLVRPLGLETFDAGLGVFFSSVLEVDLNDRDAVRRLMVSGLGDFMRSSKVFIDYMLLPVG